MRCINFTAGSRWRKPQQVDGDPDGQTELPRGGPQYALASKILSEAERYLLMWEASMPSSWHLSIEACSHSENTKERKKGREGEISIWDVTVSPL